MRTSLISGIAALGMLTACDPYSPDQRAVGGGAIGAGTGAAVGGLVGGTRRWNRSLDRWRGGGGRRGANDTVATLRTFYRLWLPIIPLLAQSVLNCRLSSFHSVDQRMNCTLCRRGCSP